MTNKDQCPEQAAELRRLAEAKVWAEESSIPDMCSPKKARMLIHELRVHQIELEIQNENLREVHAQLEALKARYFDLYDLAPVGYLTVSKEGLILEANLTAASLLGTDRTELAHQRLSQFILKEDQDSYYLHRKQLFETSDSQAYKLRMVKKDGTQFWATFKTMLARDSDGGSVCRIIMDKYVPDSGGF
jgi:PAS domain S-box-containing protein